MNAQELVKQIAARGGHVSLSGERLTAKVPEELAPEVREHKGALVYRLQRLEKLRRTDPHLQGLSDQELAEVVIAPCAHRELPDEIYYPPGCDIDAEWARLTASWDRPCQECAEAAAEQAR